jgi:hypothetical protein
MKKATSAPAVLTKTARKCQYCERVYDYSEYHETERLERHCSHGCRLACELPTSHGGGASVSIDALEDADREAYMRAPDQYEVDAIPFDNVRHVVKMITTLDTYTREIVLRRLQGEPYKAVAVAVGSALRRPVTVAGVHIALARAVKRNPWLQVLFENMVRKQHTRKGKK